MKHKMIFKDAFSVIGKMGQGPAVNPGEWILPLWEDANAHLSEIDPTVRHSGDGSVSGVWGAMNDMDETNKRWGEGGKYMAGCEADVDAQAPEGWTKWTIPAQTYLVAECTMDTYGEVFHAVCSDQNIYITGTVHERYPIPGNPNAVELYFPVAEGMIFCQSCSMPLIKPEDFGTEADGSVSRDYCCHCYGNGAFFVDETMEEMIESCIPFCLDHYGSADAARAGMQHMFPLLKRWAKTI